MLGNLSKPSGSSRLDIAEIDANGGGAELQREIGKEKSLGFLRRQGNPKIWGLEGIAMSFFFPGMQEG